MAPAKNGIDSPALSVREKTHQLLRHRLLVGELLPGQRLTEESLARDLGVSRTPIREALHKLELEGLVEPAGARGFRVPADSLAEINELFEIRAVMEGHALACLAGIIDDENLRQLEMLIERAEDACSKGELQLVFEYNTCFHDQL
ncbi:MAG: GntR family transcriptional regulator, partial [Desulfofustis sp.]